MIIKVYYKTIFHCNNKVALNSKENLFGFKENGVTLARNNSSREADVYSFKYDALVHFLLLQLSTVFNSFSQFWLLIL